ncbi:hypothetical protein CKO13_07405, partial [Halorhodospira neutriphila]|nr:hypothetical protein [Halorhodospira neutriphila]
TGHRPTALFLNPNSAAALVNLLWPTVAVAWLAGAERLLGTPRAQRALLPALFVLVFAVGLDGGRAAFLAAATALAVVLGGSAYALGVGRRRLAAVALVFVGALLAAYLVNVLGLGTGRLLGERIASLGSPDEAGAVRFLQWAATWELIREAPWLGLGPGVFWLAYAAVRPAGDGTAGMFAHNDYLHFWAERGLPAPLLVLAVGGVCVYLFVRAVRAGRIGALDPASAAGAIAAFAAVAGLGLHGLFSYQLQLASMLIPAFLLIAELERLAPARPLAVLRLPDWRRPLTLTAGAGALALVVFSVGLIGSAQRATEAGIEHTRSGDYEAAEHAFLTAQRRWGWADPPWLHHAELYQRLLAQVPAAEAELRRELMAEAMRLLDTARDRNPLRAQIPTLRGELRRDYPELTEGSPRAAFRRALALNPRAVSARLAYARLLRQEEGDEAARAVLEAGVELRYGQKAAPLPLYQVTAEARSAMGDPEGAAAMRERIESLRERLRRESGIERGVRPWLSSSTTPPTSGSSAFVTEDLIDAVGLEDAVGPGPQGVLVSRLDTLKLLLGQRTEALLEHPGEHLGFAFQPTFLPAFLVPLLLPLLLPLIHALSQHLLYLLQILDLLPLRRRLLGEGLAAQQHALHPEGELAAQPALLRLVQPLAELADDREHLLRIPAVLEPEQGVDQVAQLWGVLLLQQRLLIEDQVAHLRPVGLEPAGDVLDQLLDVGRCRPARLAVVEHHGQHRRQSPLVGELALRDEILIEQADVGHHAHRHEAVDPALELEQQVDVEPVLAPAHPPDHVVVAPAIVLGGVGAVLLLQGGEVELADPVFADVVDEQLPDHLRLGEEPLVTWVVLLRRHGGLRPLSSSVPRPSRCLGSSSTACTERPPAQGGPTAALGLGDA